MKPTKLIRRLYPAVVAVLVFTQVQAAGPDGQALYGHCVECHGEGGLGGEGGKYPRIAGLPGYYVERQLDAFKTLKRANKPMLPIFEGGDFDRDAIEAVTAYVAALPTTGFSPSAFEPTADALAQFDSREEFDDVGEEVFRDNCAECHGKDGRGLADKDTPPLVNQYPQYIAKQIADFIRADREHEHAKKMFGQLYPEEVEALLGYLDRLGRG